MPYITRNNENEIINATAQEIYGAALVPYDDPDLLDFLEKNGQDPKKILNTLDELRKSDAAMARAVEDVINALLKKNLLKMIDLPKPVQDRMAKRIKLRMEIENTLHKATNNRSNNQLESAEDHFKRDPYNS